MPTCTLIAGPNGAGKTTFALRHLPSIGCSRFVNADAIAAGLSPLAPEKESFRASRLLLQEIASCVEKREDFAFETTLSGRTYLKLVSKLLAHGWQVNLYYLWLPSVQMSLDRVAERVAKGGHSIPYEAVMRRYPRSISNLLNHYAPLCSNTICFDNAQTIPQEIFTQTHLGRNIVDKQAYQRLLEQSGD
jgi:predicted ABC-type ATPase